MRTADSDESNRKREDKWASPKDPYQKEEGMKLWGIVIFGLIGATVTTFVLGQLRRSVEWFSQQAYRSQSSWRGGTKGSFRSAYQEEAWRKYQKRMPEEYEEEMARVERIRRTQSVFNRERNKHKQSYERWRESGPGEYHQHFQREDWTIGTERPIYLSEIKGTAIERHQKAMPRILYHITMQFWVLTGLLQNLTLKQRLSQPSGQKQWSSTLIRTKITKRLLRRNSRRC